MSLAPPLQHQGAWPGLNAQCGDLLDLRRLQQPTQPCHGPAVELGSPAAQPLALTAADLLRAQQQAPLATPKDALQQLTALQQQQQLAQALSAEPLLSLGNLLAAQGLQDLLVLRQQLQQTAPVRLSTGGIRGTGPVNNALYKTELCRSWEETGNCRYGAKCQFAHGREELRPVVRHPKYKTEVCRTFASSGTCPYGTRCRFIHTTTPFAPAPSACSVADAALSSLYSPTQLTSASTSTLPPYAAAPTISTLSTAAIGLGAGSTATDLSTGLVGLPHGSTAVSPPSSFPGLATLPAAPASPSAVAGCGAAKAYSPAPAGPCSVDASPASMLAALSALLGSRTPAATPALNLSATSLTSAAAAPSPLSVVGAPAGLPAIGVGHRSPPAVQQQPICPGTPVATAGAGVRRSISDCDASTPGSFMKRLPIFERLIPEDDCAAAATALSSLAGAAT